MASWAIATTCRDCVEVVLAFTAHHLEAGAGEIFLFFDDPDDPAFDWVSGIERVHAFRCDDAHWAETGAPRPPRHQQRQSGNAARAKAMTKCDWIGHIDVDEYVDGPGPLGEFLDEIAAQYEAVRLHPVERIFTQVPDLTTASFEGGFKRPMPKRIGRRLFPRHGALLHRGFQGHANGKTFLRTGSAGHLRIHNARLPGGAAVPYFPGEVPNHILHFFPFSYPAWREKFSRRLNVPGTLEGLNAREQEKFGLYADALARGEDAVWRLFLDFSYFGPVRLQRLKASGFFYDPQIDFRAAVHRVFGAEAPVFPKPQRQSLLTRLIGA